MADIIDLYISKISIIKDIDINIDIDILLNKTLTIYYDENLADIYPHKKKSLCIAYFFKYIDNVIDNKILQKHTTCFCFRKNKHTKIDTKIDTKISKYFYNHKIPVFVDELLQLYRNKDKLNIDEIKQNNRHDDLFLLLNYENTDIFSDKIMIMTQKNKIVIIKNILLDIIII